MCRCEGWPQAQNQPRPQGPTQVLGSAAPADHKAETMLGAVLKVGFQRRLAQWQQRNSRSFPQGRRLNPGPQ